MAKVYNCSDFEVMRTGLATVLFDVPETGIEDFLDAAEFGAPEVAPAVKSVRRFLQCDYRRTQR